MRLPQGFLLDDEYGEIESNKLLAMILPYARPEVSGFQVGAFAFADSGRVYWGVNLEFAGQAIQHTVHAEQFAVAQARAAGETKLNTIAVSATPCGHCRQWLLELGDAELDILTYLQDEDDWDENALIDLLSNPFMLAKDALNLLTPPQTSINTCASLDDYAHLAYEHAYAPYTQAGSGIALQLESGAMVTGAVLESAAFNPTLPPLQVALTHIVSAGLPYSAIQHALLCERSDAVLSYRFATQALLHAIAPNAALDLLLLD